MELRFSRDGSLFVISENRRKKYVELLQRYLDRGKLLRPQASQLAGRLNWACNALFGRCGRAFLSPILACAAQREARPELNKDLAIAVTWWKRWLSALRGDLSRFVPATRRRVGSPAISYSDTSTDFGLGGVLVLSTTREAFWFRTRVPPGDPIDRLEVEAAAIVDALFGPLWRSVATRRRSPSWTTTSAWRGSPAAAPVLTSTPCSPACGSRWRFVGASSGFSASPPPPTSRTSPAGASPPTVCVVGACGNCRLSSTGGRRMVRALAGPSLGLQRLGDAHSVWGDASGTVGCSNMSCYNVATLGRGSRLICPRLRRVLLAHTLPHLLRASLPKC